MRVCEQVGRRCSWCLSSRCSEFVRRAVIRLLALLAAAGATAAGAAPLPTADVSLRAPPTSAAARCRRRLQPALDACRTAMLLCAPIRPVSLD